MGIAGSGHVGAHHLRHLKGGQSAARSPAEGLVADYVSHMGEAQGSPGQDYNIPDSGTYGLQCCCYCIKQYHH